MILKALVITLLNKFESLNRVVVEMYQATIFSLYLVSLSLFVWALSLFLFCHSGKSAKFRACETSDS